MMKSATETSNKIIMKPTKILGSKTLNFSADMAGDVSYVSSLQLYVLKFYDVAFSTRARGGLKLRYSIVLLNSYLEKSVFVIFIYYFSLVNIQRKY